jgi:hypothetical protein
MFRMFLIGITVVLYTAAYYTDPKERFAKQMKKIQSLREDVNKMYQVTNKMYEVLQSNEYKNGFLKYAYDTIAVLLGDITYECRQLDCGAGIDLDRFSIAWSEEISAEQDELNLLEAARDYILTIIPDGTQNEDLIKARSNVGEIAVAWAHKIALMQSSILEFMEYSEILEFMQSAQIRYVSGITNILMEDELQVDYRKQATLAIQNLLIAARQAGVDIE